jgi:mono/diheme cytochrome c family protein
MAHLFRAPGREIRYGLLVRKGTSTVLRYRRWLLKKRTFRGNKSLSTQLKKTSLLIVAICAAICLFGFAVWAQKPKEPPAEFRIPPDAATKSNPVKPGADSLARGKKLYGYDCAMCHGKTGDGKGDMATDMKNIQDFTKPEALKGRSDGDLFYIIRNGKGEDMPPEGDRAKDDDIWHLVNYVRSLAKK